MAETGSMTDRRRQILIGLVAVLVSAVVVIIWWSNRMVLPDTTSPPVHGLAFFDVGETTVLSRGLQTSLESVLGESAIEGWSPVDLSDGGHAYLPGRFPDLEALNKGLSLKDGTLAGNATWKLVFRYAKLNGLPFSHIKMVFDKKTERPLFIQARAASGQQDFSTTLTAKFGQPAITNGPDRTLESRVWTEGENLLIASRVPNKIDVVAWHLYIYFKGNIQALVNRLEADAAASAVSEPSAF
ncbi:MAG: hypothetical protein CSA22_05385 [Deltaproteobacteria bacterium]|nr:MAG: hypothetical protein CSA22_05385 [Deltaproteobacteria bacterium]